MQAVSRARAERGGEGVERVWFEINIAAIYRWPSVIGEAFKCTVRIIRCKWNAHSVGV